MTFEGLGEFFRASNGCKEVDCSMDTEMGSIISGFRVGLILERFDATGGSFIVALLNVV